MNEQQIRNILRVHFGRFGSPIHRLYTTGEITEHTDQALRDRMVQLTLAARDPEADQIEDVIDYVTQVGCRPPVTRWTTSATRGQQ
ncbi:hypothetical protein [Streptomyces sp. SCL15-4]|uniref:hypothetical protein n=1 Tax=Streptomyces sp. SCL15-4 TaxID=2967221 RepID=UPI0029673556|nr:hypothetical protein [Streptomyces sp. SCL15-4]